MPSLIPHPSSAPPPQPPSSDVHVHVDVGSVAGRHSVIQKHGVASSDMAAPSKEENEGAAKDNSEFATIDEGERAGPSTPELEKTIATSDKAKKLQEKRAQKWRDEVQRRRNELIRRYGDRPEDELMALKHMEELLKKREAAIKKLRKAERFVNRCRKFYGWDKSPDAELRSLVIPPPDYVSPWTLDN